MTLACGSISALANFELRSRRKLRCLRRPVATFTDIAEKAGLTTPNIFGGLDTKKYIIETTGNGVAIFDYDNDGWPDIFLVNGTKLEGFPAGKAPTNRLYRNNHDGTFTDVTAKAGLTATGWGQGVCVGDYDNDGWEDLYITYYGKNRLYHNRSRRLHRSRAKSPASRDRVRPGARAVRSWITTATAVSIWWWRTTWISIWRPRPHPVSAPPASGRAFPSCAVRAAWLGAKNILYHNRGDGTFEDVTTKAHIDRTDGHYAFSVSTFDFDEDGWPDIFIACDSTPSILYRNNHDGTFTDVAVTAGAAFNEDGREQAGMGSTIGDYNGDGHLDIFKTNFSDDTSTLYKNNGDGTFTDATTAAGLGLYTQYLGWGTMFFDIDNDGWPDLILVNGHVYPEVDSQHLGSSYKEPRILFHNNGDGTFSDISASAGPAITHSGFLSRPGGGGFVERRKNLGRDQQHERRSQPAGESGSQFESLDRDSYRRNEIESRRHRRAHSREDRVRASSWTKFAAARATSRTVICGFTSGLGKADKIDWVEIRWPSGCTERFANLPVDQIHTLKEGTGAPVEPSRRNRSNLYLPGFASSSENCIGARVIPSPSFT